MKNLSKAEFSIDQFPADLRLVFEECDLLSLVLESCHEAPPPPGPNEFSRSSESCPEGAVLLTILAYAFSCNIINSEDILRAAENEPGLMYLCRGREIAPDMLSYFRDLARKHLEEVLAKVLLKACDAEFSTDVSEILEPMARRAAQTRITQAIRTDILACEIDR